MSPATTVLLVEDDAVIREIVTAILTGAGYRVTTVACVASARDALAATPFDVVLTDAFVAPTPGKTDYWRALDVVAAHAGTARLIIFTAYRERDFPGFRGHGFTAILVKPFRLATLVATVADALLPRDERPLHASRFA